MLTLEVCVADVESLLAVEVVAPTTTDIQVRVEVCAALEVGGLTPTLAMLDLYTQQSVNPAVLPRHVLIRPRAGDFCYTELEQQQMLHDMRYITEHFKTQQHVLGGFVVGCLTYKYEVDTGMIEPLLSEFYTTPFTFHRAIDQCTDILSATRQLIALHQRHPNLKYILTSGGCETAQHGAETIRQMQQLCASTPGCSLQVMAAAGINEQNLAGIINQSNVTYVHGSFREPRSEQTVRSLAPATNSRYIAGAIATLQRQQSSPLQKPAVKMGAADSAERLVTSVHKMRAVLTSMRHAAAANG